jgi:hypothetical protein
VHDLPFFDGHVDDLSRDLGRDFHFDLRLDLAGCGNELRDRFPERLVGCDKGRLLALFDMTPATAAMATTRMIPTIQ